MLDIWRQETCWRTARAGRAAFLVDYQAYFAAVQEALLNASHSIHLLGWGFDPRTRLAPDGSDGGGEPDQVGRLLLRIAAERPDLDIRLLIWKSALPISATQEFFPHKAREWFKGSTIRFWLDDALPLGACHHQKALIIDDQIAFSGSGDIARDRWDSPAHLDEDRRRACHGHDAHPPRHEVMTLVDGEAAKALGELFRKRWAHATKETMTSPSVAPATDPWPKFLPADLRGVQVGISRTVPAWRGDPAATEIRQLNVDAIYAAKRSIYIENQYFTDPSVAEALAARLNEPGGPEIVLVSTEQAPSWFDRLTMDRVRGVMIRRLQQADVFGRFRAYSPVTTGGQAIIVHSKLMIIDDALARVGSANLNNRSGGFDTECDLGFEARDEEQGQAIAAFRWNLLGHWMARDAAAAKKAAGPNGSMIAAIDALNRHGRLKPIRPQVLTKTQRIIADFHLGDPSGVGDSFRPFKRRRRLDRAVRTIAADHGMRRFIQSLKNRLSGEDGPRPPGF